MHIIYNVSNIIYIIYIICMYSKAVRSIEYDDSSLAEFAGNILKLYRGLFNIIEWVSFIFLEKHALK